MNRHFLRVKFKRVANSDLAPCVVRVVRRVVLGVVVLSCLGQEVEGLGVAATLDSVQEALDGLVYILRCVCV